MKTKISRYKILFFLLLLLFAESSIAQCINTFPATETFESGPVWTVGGNNSDWAWGTPSKPVITGPGGGTKSWVTAGLTGSVYNLSEQSYIQSPCYDFTSLTYPHVKFKIFWETEYKYDGGNLQYSINGGTTWINVGAFGDPVDCMTANWYDYASITYLNSPAWIPTRHGWSGNIQASYPSGGTTCQGGNGSAGWVVAQHCLNGLAGQPNVIFRFTYGSGTTCNSYDGLAIDDFTIENGPPNTPNFTFACAGINTIAFTSTTQPCPVTVTYAWNFGDAASGTNTSSAANPTHVFSAPGTYTVSLTTTGGPCNPPGTITKTVVIMNAAIGASSPVSCFGGNNGSASVTGSNGTTPYSYSWSPSGGSAATASSLAAGNYTVTVTDAAGCMATASTTIAQPVVLSAVTAGSNVNCNGGNNGTATVTANGGTAPYTYSWSPGGAASASATTLTAGTYTVTVTDAHACTVTATAVISQPTPLTVSAASTPVSCSGGNDGTATSTVNGGTSPYTYSWSPSGGTASGAAMLAAATYTVTVMDAKGCTATASTNIAQPSALTVSASGTNATCGNPNGMATATVSGGTSAYTYSWAPSGGTAASATALGAGTYTITVTDAHLCTSTATTTITNTGGVTITASSTPVNCFGGNDGTASVAVSGGVSPYSYLWSPGAATTVSISALTAGTYTISVTDASGCVNSSTATVMQPSVISSSTAANPVSCNGGGNGSATVNPSGGTLPYTYAWAPGGGSTQAISGLSAGSYSVTITDAHNCVATNTVLISQPAVLGASTSATPTNCQGSADGTATATATGGTMPYTYLWSPSGETGAIASGLIAGTYTVTVSDSNSCSTTASAIVTQPVQLSVMVANTSGTCGNANGTATATGAGGTSPYTYLWSAGAGASSTATGLAAGTYTVTVTDSHSCVATASTPVQNTGAVSASATSVAVSCFGGNNGTATASGSGGRPSYNYSWSPGGATTLTATNLSAGSYTVTVTDSAGCTATASATVTQPSQVVVNTTGMVVCNGQGATLNADGSGGTFPYTFNWNAGSFSGNPYMFTPSASGVYSVTATDANGCVSVADTAHVTVLPPLAAVASADQVICPGGSASISATGNGGNGNYNFVWTPGNIPGSTVTVTPGSSSTYTVTLTDGCTVASAQDTIHITLAPLPQISFSGDNLAGCSPVCVNFTDNTSILQGTISSWSWVFGDGSTSVLQSPVHCYTNPGLFSVSLSATSQLGCSSTVTYNNYIDVYSNPVAAFTPDPTETDIYSSGVNFQNSTVNGNTYFWNFGDSTNSVLAGPSHNYPVPGTYNVWLIATSSNGCIDSVMHPLVINDVFTFYAPNAFTPNSDALNESFLPKGEGWDTNGFDLWIYDRWGNMCFHSSETNKGWDGKANHGSELAQQDVYVWKVNLKDIFGRKHHYMGTVTIVK